jgi:hypothetical protein
VVIDKLLQPDTVVCGGNTKISNKCPCPKDFSFSRAQEPGHCFTALIIIVTVVLWEHRGGCTKLCERVWERRWHFEDGLMEKRQKRAFEIEIKICSKRAKHS